MTTQQEQYFRTVLTIEVLTAHEAFNGDVAELSETIVNGDASGLELVRVVEEVNETEMSRLLTAHGSDPEFLILPENCAACGAPIHRDDHGTWIDDTDGDACEDNLPHSPTGLPHDARPDDDSQPGSRCKDCGKPVTWVGPSHTDWEHVAESDDAEERERDHPDRPRTHCGCGYSIVYIGYGEWQHDAAPYFWGDDHDADAQEDPKALLAAEAWDKEHKEDGDDD